MAGNRDDNGPGDTTEPRKSSLLAKYMTSPAADGNSAGNTDDNDAGNMESTPIVRGNLVATDGPHAQMLDLRFRNGSRRAFPYSYLSEIRFDPSGDLVCVFPVSTVTISGRNLAAIYTAITNHTALAVIESPSGFDDGGDEPYVQSI
mgnify:CR=1 FL=1